MFQPAIYNLVKGLVQDLIYKLEKKNYTFASFATTYLPKSTFVKISSLIAKLTEVRKNIQSCLNTILTVLPASNICVSAVHVACT